MNPELVLKISPLTFARRDSFQEEGVLKESLKIDSHFKNTLRLT